MRKRRRKAWVGLPSFIIAFLPAACTVGPDYVRSTAPVPAAYKELKGWKRATPGDDVDRGTWWDVFKDKKLDTFESQIELSNQTVAAAQAAYWQSLAIIKERLLEQSEDQVRSFAEFTRDLGEFSMDVLGQFWQTRERAN